MANINIYGTFRSMAEDQKVVSADQVVDDNVGKDQETINEEVQEALSQIGGGSAEDTTYDNTDSKLLSTNVQDAIDELNLNAMRMASIASLGYDLLEYGELPIDMIGLAYGKELYGTSAKNFSNSAGSNADLNLVYLPVMDWTYFFRSAVKTNPKSNGLYEKSDTLSNSYFLTQDTSQVSGKTYYEIVRTDANVSSWWHQLFRGCTNLKVIPNEPFRGFGNIMGNYTFRDCTKLKKVGNISTRLNGFGTFYGCTALEEVGNINGTAANGLNNTFANCNNLVKVGTITVSTGCTTTANMFAHCYKLTAFDLDGDLSSVTGSNSMFINCKALEEINVVLNLSSCTNMSSMFSSCNALKRVAGLDVSAVTSLSSCFTGCYNVEELTIYNLGKSSLTSYDFHALSKWGTTNDGAVTLHDTFINAPTTSGITVKLSTATKAVYDGFPPADKQAISNKNITITS
jgi:hypothetical protein